MVYPINDRKEDITLSRLGDLIRTERIRAKLTPKQVAKKCGVAESYLIAVENASTREKSRLHAKASSRRS